MGGKRISGRKSNRTRMTLMKMVGTTITKISSQRGLRSLIIKGKEEAKAVVKRRGERRMIMTLRRWAMGMAQRQMKAGPVKTSTRVAF